MNNNKEDDDNNKSSKRQKLMLWDNNDINVWNLERINYNERIKWLENERKYEDMIEIDNYMWNIIPKIINKQKYINLNQLKKIVQWKLHRGKFRPLMKKVDENNNELVIKISKECLNNPPKSYENDKQMRQRIKKICELKGVGPATASGILAAFFPMQYGFMADETIVACGLDRKYDMKTLINMMNLLHDKQIMLNNIIDEKNLDIKKFSINDISQCLWSSAIKTSNRLQKSAKRKPNIY